MVLRGRRLLFLGCLSKEMKANDFPLTARVVFLALKVFTCMFPYKVTLGYPFLSSPMDGVAMLELIDLQPSDPQTDYCRRCRCRRSMVFLLFSN